MLGAYVWNRVDLPVLNTLFHQGIIVFLVIWIDFMVKLSLLNADRSESRGSDEMKILLLRDRYSFDWNTALGRRWRIDLEKQ